ncbi:MAG: glycosyltransferase family 4 protein [Gemmataceae bacterium]
MAKQKSITHMIPALFFAKDGIVGGAERYAYELARHMAKVAPTSLVTFGHQSRHFRVEDLEVRVIGNCHFVRGQRSNPIAWSLIREVARADVVHCHQHHILASSTAALLGMLFRRPIFVSDLGGGGWDISGYIRTDRWFRGHLHISQYSRSVANHADKDWAHVIYGGIDTERFSPKQSDQENTQRAVLYVGRLLPHKGVNYLVEGVPDDVPLRLVGKPYNVDYLKLLKTLAEGKRVSFEHDCTDAELIAAYQECLCVVLPSVYRTILGQESRVPELLGQTLLEGMACGVPAICSDVASMPEVVEDGVTGFVVPPNDPEALREKIVWLIEHPAERQRMGLAARERVLNHFTWDVVVRRCLEVYGN